MITNEVLYKLNIPTKIYFGRNIWKKTIFEMAEKSEFLLGNILIVTTGRSLKRLGYLDEMQALLEQIESVSNVFIFDEISANPRLSEVEKAVEFGKNKSINLVIGFGGGSALDAAKAVSAGIACDEKITDMFRNGISPTKAIPLVAMPTTAGTGSELSKAAILSDDENHKKGGLRGDKMFPAIAIVDSSFTESVPFNITMETGFDVLAHAIESYVSKVSTPFTELLSEYVIREAGEAIRNLIDDLNNVEARSRLSFCSMIMGINLGNASTALPHRMQYPIGAYTDSSHGIGLAAMYPAWFKYEKEYSEDKIEKVLELLKYDSIEKMLECMKINKTLSDLGICEEQVDALVSEVSGSIGNDPASHEENVIRKIYLESL